jgi:hypothetical protein
MTNGIYVDTAFGWGFSTTQWLDGKDKQITFADGAGGYVTVVANVQWITDQDRIVRTHSHGLNFIVWNQAITMSIRDTDVPQTAVLAANSYIDICNPGDPIAKQYRIDSAFLENHIWQVDLQVFRTSNH